MTEPSDKPPRTALTTPLPTPATLSWRKNLLWQILRFVRINLKMFRMIRLSHPHRVSDREA